MYILSIINCIIFDFQAGKTVVAFYASNGPSSITLGENETVEYGVVKFNHGNCYDKSTGHFSCPVKGLYHFNMSAVCIGDNLHLSLFKNESMVTHILTYGVGTAASVSLPLLLEKGDNVYVKHVERYEESIHYGDLTNFSGYLVYEV